MEEIKALNDSAGPTIPAILQPTTQIFVPLLMKNKAAIHSIPPITQSYGSNPRQKLDIYLSAKNTKFSPFLVFFHGGGLIGGDKIIPRVPDGLVYANLGTYFASRGLTTIIPNYRRVNSEIGGENAVFPSGGEDVSLVMKWLEAFASDGKRDVYISGNSAGGVHISTFMFDPTFLEQRKSYLSGKSTITLKGAIAIAVPFHFKRANPERSDVLKLYYGTPEEVSQHSAYGLLEAIAKTGKSRQEAAVPKVLVLLGEYDPEDEIKEPTVDFVALWKKIWGEGINFEKLEGHNHISPPWALMSNDAEGEKWGEEVVKWIQESSS
jgi:hypothetical protein